MFKYRAVFNTRIGPQRKHPAATSLLEFQTSGGQVVRNKRTIQTNTRECCEEKLQGANKTYRNVSVRGVGKVPRGSDTQVDSEGRTASEETLPREQRKGRRPEGAGCFQEREGRREHTEQEEPAPAQAGLQGCSCTREEWLPLNHAGLPDEWGCQKWRCPSQHWKRCFARTQKSHTKLNLLQALDLPIDTRVSFLLAAAPPSIYLALPVDLCDLKSQQN